MHRVQRPEFVGTLATILQKSIEHAELVVGCLLDRGDLRWATQAELHEMNASQKASAVMLVGKFSPAIAHKP